MNRPGKIALLCVTGLGVAGCVFLAAFLVGQGLDRASLWAAVLGLPVGAVAAGAGVWAVAAQSSVTPVQPDPAARLSSPRPVKEWSGHRLGVHPAISRSLRHAGQDFVLPAYIPRRHDGELRSFLTTVADRGHTALVVIRGQSCTGKTRTAFEAVRAALPGWHLMFPVSVGSLLAVLAADSVRPRTVLWLDEAQDFLSGAEGERAAAALRHRLDQPGPAVIVATLWPEYYRDLSGAPASGVPDTHSRARALLAGAHRVDVPPAFSDRDLTMVRAQASSDPALAVAEKTGAPNITQILAAGPDLVDRYEHPTGPDGPYGQAVISAAMDAHRLGLTGAIPLTLLAAAAPGYLDRDQRASADPDSWFAQALSYARTKVRDVTPALLDIPRPTAVGACPGVVRLADFLGHHGRTARRLVCPPEAFWDAAACHMDAAGDLTRLAHSAQARLRYRHAERLYLHAYDAGDHSALGLLSLMLTEAGDRHRAADIRGQSANAGDTFACELIALEWDRIGESGQAEYFLQQAAEAGHPALWVSLAWMRANIQDREGVERFVRKAAYAGHSIAPGELGGIWKQAGDYARAERLYRQAADAGELYYLRDLARIREELGDHEAADRLYQQAADSEDPLATVARIQEIQEQSADPSAAERLAAWASDTGDTGVLLVIARVRKASGDHAGAERLYQQAAHARDPYALASLARIREESGDPSGAERLAWRAADGGDASALRDLAQTRDEPRWKQLLRYGLEPDGSISDPW